MKIKTVSSWLKIIEVSMDDGRIHLMHKNDLVATLNGNDLDIEPVLPLTIRDFIDNKWLAARGLEG